MTRFSKPTMVIMALIAFSVISVCALAQTPTHYVVTNDDQASGNTATIYQAGGSAGLTQVKVVSTGGTGLGGGYFATGRVGVQHDGRGQCFYISNAGTGDITSISATTLNKVGNFSGSSSDDGSTLGIGLAINGKYLYAAYTASNTIATFGIGAGCNLKFLGDIDALGLSGGSTDGMAGHGNILVVTYGDGSIESFDVSGGIPVSNNYLQNSSVFAAGNWPGGVDITKDGKYAVFGDIPTVNGFTTVEVSNISSGKLTATTVFGSDGSLGSATNSNNVLLSPDETVLYISNNSSGQVTAAFFDATTGAVTNGCTSPVMRKFFGTWFYTSGLGMGSPKGTGGNVYVAEWGGGLSSSIGVLGLTKTGSGCTLQETGYSPITDANSVGLLSLGTYPARPF